MSAPIEPLDNLSRVALFSLGPNGQHERPLRVDYCVEPRVAYSIERDNQLATQIDVGGPLPIEKWACERWALRAGTIHIGQRRQDPLGNPFDHFKFLPARPSHRLFWLFSSDRNSHIRT